MKPFSCSSCWFVSFLLSISQYLTSVLMGESQCSQLRNLSPSSHTAQWLKSITVRHWFNFKCLWMSFHWWPEEDWCFSQCVRRRYCWHQADICPLILKWRVMARVHIDGSSKNHLIKVTRLRGDNLEQMNHCKALRWLCVSHRADFSVDRVFLLVTSEGGACAVTWWRDGKRWPHQAESSRLPSISILGKKQAPDCCAMGCCFPAVSGLKLLPGPAWQ